MSMHRRLSPALGGPGTLLPSPIESLLSWSLCVSCLSVSGYHYCVATFVGPALNRWRALVRRLLAGTLTFGEKRIKHGSNGNGDEGELLPFQRAWIPLTTFSRYEMDRFTPRRRLEQLTAALERLLGPQTRWEDCDDRALVAAIRSDEICRRLASLAMRPHPRSTEDGNGLETKASMDTLLECAPELELPWRLARIWPDLLALPPQLSSEECGRYPFDISLVVPAFRELGSDVGRKLDRALRFCARPQRVEIVLVDAGGCTGLEKVVRSHRLQSRSEERRWGSVRCVEFRRGGGRGPCLNFGAEEASGKVLTFCHSDTALPECWDEGVIHTLFPPASKKRESSGNQKNDVIRANSCAFHFGIDTSSAGLNGGPFPPGIRAVETTANLRTRMYSLPYGDQCLSLPSDVFNFLGGFPDQCLFEDYELVALLRRRSALLPRLGLAPDDREQLKIVDCLPALCSPRRWQTFGVLHVTYMNSKLVNMYAGGMGPDDIYRRYYGADPPIREAEESPWENLAKTKGII